jgi:serine protease inhibitor
MTWDDFKVDLRIPRVEARNADRLDLKPILRDEMGWSTAFDKDRADFTRMHKREVCEGGCCKEIKMWIEFIYHDAVMILNETGCKAAAAQDNFAPKEIYLDHPFACMIEQPYTDLILFAGVVRPDAISSP